MLHWYATVTKDKRVSHTIKATQHTRLKRYLFPDASIVENTYRNTYHVR